MPNSNNKTPLPELPVYEVEEVPAERRLQEERRSAGRDVKKIDVERRKATERRGSSKK
jgi:predicted nucleotidyltransferase component of viral defense system